MTRPSRPRRAERPSRYPRRPAHARRRPSAMPLQSPRRPYLDRHKRRRRGFRATGITPGQLSTPSVKAGLAKFPALTKLPNRQSRPSLSRNQLAPATLQRDVSFVLLLCHRVASKKESPHDTLSGPLDARRRFTGRLHYFQYDSQERVITEVASGEGCSVCSDGQGTYTYTYTTSSNSPGENSWQTETTETLPDGTQNFVYTNAYGNVMLSAHVDGDNVTINYYEYDVQGLCILAASPSAVTGYDDSYADLVNFADGTAEYLSTDSGLLTFYTYYSSTTATSSTAGGGSVTTSRSTFRTDSRAPQCRKRRGPTTRTRPAASPSTISRPTPSTATTTAPARKPPTTHRRCKTIIYRIGALRME